MIQFEKMEDALLAVIHNNGVKTLQQSKIMIALLSDYAPELSAQQHILRNFLRSDSNNVLYDAVTHKCSWIEILPHIYQIILDANTPTVEIEWLCSCVMSFVKMANPNFDSDTSQEEIFQEGMKYLRQRPKERNIPIAILLLCEAGKAGNAESYHYVANCYLKGKGIPIDIQRGLEYLMLAVDGGSEPATLDLAERYFHGRDVEVDHLHAISLLKRLKSSSQASYLMGEIYSKNQMNLEAYSAYLMSAKAGNVYGQYAVALCFALGKGITRDMNSAKKWLISAARLGHGEARQKLIELGESWE